jgi:large subunit ribosomal protein L2
MAIKTIKPRSSGKRSVVLVNYKKHLTNGVRPTKNLIKNIHNQSGRNNQGKITVRQQAGGNQRKYRDIDFKRKVFNIPAVVKTIEYDPNRTSFICLIAYANGLKSYIIAPKDIKVGDTIINADVADIKIGNCMKVGNIPEGTFVHNVELIPGNGGILARGAGTSVQVLGKDETGKFTVLKLASGETRKTPNDSLATIGLVSNEDHNIINLGKAGKSRHLGIKPTVRGSAMNPIDHPHGGGEGRQGIGRDAPRSP